MKNWWQIEIDETAQELSTSITDGISQEEAKERLSRYGPNRLKEKRRKSPFKLFLEQFEDFIIWVLIAAACVSGFLKEWIDAFAIIAIVILNAIKKPLVILMQGAFIATCSLFAFCFVLYIEKAGVPRARTAAFIVLSCSQLFHSFNCRSMRDSIFKLGIFSNIQLVIAAIISFMLQMAVVYVPVLAKIFKIEALGIQDWLLLLIISSFPLWAVEVFKMLGRRFYVSKYR